MTEKWKDESGADVTAREQAELSRTVDETGAVVAVKEEQAVRGSAGRDGSEL